MPVILEPNREALQQLASELSGSPVPDLELTQQEFLNWLPADMRAEWAHGDVILMAPGNFDHEDINEWLITVTRTFVDERGLGVVKGNNFFTQLSGTLRLPDLSFVSSERASIVKHTRMEGSPDLVMEIVSPDSRNRDRREKFLEYESNGVREFWIIDPILRTVDLYVFDPSAKTFVDKPAVDGKFHSSVLPGYYLRPEWLVGVSRPTPISVFREWQLV